MTEDEVKKLAEAVKFQNRKFVSMVYDNDGGDILVLTDDGQIYVLDRDENEFFLWKEIKEKRKRKEDPDVVSFKEFFNGK